MADELRGAPCWIDLLTSDAPATKAFYSELFGWTVFEAGEEFGGYANFLRDGEPVAGCMPNSPEMGAPDGWGVFLETSDAEKTAELALSNGGQVMAPAMDVADLGRMTVVVDPSGAVIGAWQPGTHTGFAARDVVNAPSWFELHTHDYDKAVPFYREVFGWETDVMSDTPEFRYTTLGAGMEHARAGIMDSSAFMPAEIPSHWTVYFRVDDTDKQVERVVALGGTLEVPAEDTPFGRLAEVADPTGARFKLVS
jgi:predicted enzyme related to lactoylglutathione lyase